jgi:hypothetical protein
MLDWPSLLIASDTESAKTHALPDWNAAVILSLLLSPLFKLL